MSGVDTKSEHFIYHNNNGNGNGNGNGNPGGNHGAAVSASGQGAPAFHYYTGVGSPPAGGHGGGKSEEEEEEEEERSLRGKRKANEDLEEAESRRKRGSYKCSKCGQPKKGHVCIELPHSTPVLPSPTFEGSSITPNYGTSQGYEYTPQNFVSPAPSDQNTAHLMTVITQLESQIKMLHRENLQLRSHLSRWYELANLGDVPPYGPPDRQSKLSSDFSFKRYNPPDFPNPSNASPNHSPKLTAPLPHTLPPGVLTSPNLSPGAAGPDFRASPNISYDRLGHRYPTNKRPLHPKTVYPGEGSFEGDGEEELIEEDIHLPRNYPQQSPGLGIRENGKT